MKQHLKYLLVFLYVVLCIQQGKAQIMLKVTEGRLEFVHPDYGIVMHNQTGYFIYDIQFKGWDYYKRDTIHLSIEQYNGLKANLQRITAGDIGTIDLKKLKKKSFVARNSDNDKEFELFMLNDATFTTSEVHFEDPDTKRNACNCENIPYALLTFPDGQELVYIEERMVVVPNRGTYTLFEPVFQKKKKLAGLADIYDSPFSRHFMSNTIKKKKLTFCQIFKNNNQLEKTPFTIDSLPNHKVQLINYAGKNVLATEYDSIKANYFIVGYSNGKADLYDYTLRKLPFKNVRQVHFAQPYPLADILDGNTVKHINITGKTTRVKEWPYLNLDYYPSEHITIVYKNGQYYFEIQEEILQRLYHTENLSALHFADDQTVTGSNYIDTMPALFFKNKDGGYGACVADYLTNPDYVLTEIEAMMLNADEVVPMQPGNRLRVKKGNLYALFPISEKGFRYKKLLDYKNSFARYTLQSGEKGWLDLYGNEYPDE